MKKQHFTILLCLASLLIGLCACGNTGSSATPTSSPSPAPVSDTAAPAPSPSSNSDESAEIDALLENIIVEMKIDSALSQAIVTISNNGSMTFSGNIHTRFYDSSNNRAGSDIIFVEDLTAGNYTYARISLKSTSNISMKYEISNPIFTEGANSEGGVLDEDASAALAEDFEGSFGGAGNPAWATSWYGYVTNIEVFTSDANNYAIITVSKDTDKDAVNRIGNAIFGNYATDYELATVLVMDLDGNILFERAAK